MVKQFDNTKLMSRIKELENRIKQTQMDSKSYFSEDDLEEKYDEGYDEGYDAGRDAVYQDAYDEGNKDGYEEAVADQENDVNCAIADFLKDAEELAKYGTDAQKIAFVDALGDAHDLETLPAFNVLSSAI